MKFADVRSGFKLAVVVNGCLFITAMLSQSADLADFVFSPVDDGAVSHLRRLLLALPQVCSRS